MFREALRPAAWPGRAHRESGDKPALSPCVRNLGRCKNRGRRILLAGARSRLLAVIDPEPDATVKFGVRSGDHDIEARGFQIARHVLFAIPPCLFSRHRPGQRAQADLDGKPLVAGLHFASRILRRRSFAHAISFGLIRNAVVPTGPFIDTALVSNCNRISSSPVSITSYDVR